jgi:hypothetical protein
MFWCYFVFLSFCGIIFTFRSGLNVESSPKNDKMKNATKTPNL